MALRFLKAVEEDIPKIAEIEEEFFGDYDKKFDYEFLQKWYQYNPDMFYVIKEQKDDETIGDVLAFTILTPVTREAYEKILSGTISDMFDFKEEDVLQNMESDYYYFSDICVSRKKKPVNELKVFIKLRTGIIDFFHQFAKRILTLPVTDKGLKMSKQFGFETITKDSEGHPICELVLTDEVKRKFKKKLERV